MERMASLFFVGTVFSFYFLLYIFSFFSQKLNETMEYLLLMSNPLTVFVRECIVLDNLSQVISEQERVFYSVLG